MQARLDLAAQAQGVGRGIAWGPWEFTKTLSEACQQMEKLQEEELVLQAALKNQLLVFRPNDTGDLICVDDEPWEPLFQRKPPSKGLRPAWCEARVEAAAEWGDEGPPKPDWSALDKLGQYLEVVPPRDGPENEEDYLELPRDQLDLTPEQERMLLPIEERLRAIPLEPDLQSRVANSWARQRLRQTRKKRTGRWAGTLGNRPLHKQAAKWRQKVREAGQSVEKFRETMRPLVRGAEALRNMARKGLTRKARAQKKSSAQEPPQVVDQDLEEQPHLRQEVRVVAQDSDLAGKRSHVIRVY